MQLYFSVFAHFEKSFRETVLQIGDFLFHRTHKFFWLVGKKKSEKLTKMVLKTDKKLGCFSAWIIWGFPCYRQFFFSFLKIHNLPGFTPIFCSWACIKFGYLADEVDHICWGLIHHEWHLKDFLKLNIKNRKILWLEQLMIFNSSVPFYFSPFSGLFFWDGGVRDEWLIFKLLAGWTSPPPAGVGVQNPGTNLWSSAFRKKSLQKKNPIHKAINATNIFLSEGLRRGGCWLAAGAPSCCTAWVSACQKNRGPEMWALIELECLAGRKENGQRQWIFAVGDIWVAEVGDGGVSSPLGPEIGGRLGALTKAAREIPRGKKRNEKLFLVPTEIAGEKKNLWN